MDECINPVGDAKIFPTLDANGGDLRVNITEEDQDQDKTAFKSQHSQFRFSRIKFGLKNAFRLFQRPIDSQLKKVKGKNVLIY